MDDNWTNGVWSSKKVKECSKHHRGTGFVPAESLEGIAEAMERLEKTVRRSQKRYEGAEHNLKKQKERSNTLLSAAEKLRQDLQKQRFHLGRNQMKKKNMGPHARANLVEIDTHVTRTFRYIKIFDPSWSVYLPNDCNSFYNKIINDLEAPSDKHPELYWYREIVPLINSKLCDKRSDATKNVKKGYLGKNAMI